MFRTSALGLLLGASSQDIFLGAQNASWLSRTLVKDEGNELRSMQALSGTNCTRACEADDACHSVSYTMQWSTCHLKDKCVTSSDASGSNGDYVTLYKPCSSPPPPTTTTPAPPPTPWDGRHSCSAVNTCVPHTAPGAQYKDLHDCQAGCLPRKCHHSCVDCNPGPLINFDCIPPSDCMYCNPGQECFVSYDESDCKGDARFDLPPVAPNDLHYGSPAAGCLADEVALEFQGVNRTMHAVCSMACLQDGDCASDASDGSTAAPACAVNQPIGQGKQCVLQCSEDKDCGSNAYGGSCVDIYGYKMCLFDK